MSLDGGRLGVRRANVDVLRHRAPTVQAAATALYIAPILLIFFFAQRYFVQSNVSSGIKG